MLITQYQLRRGEWRPVKQYYEFRSPELESRSGCMTVPKRPCPGCGRRLSATAQNQHTCLGGTELWPKLDNRRLRRESMTSEDVLEEYVRTVKHPVVFSDES